MRDHIKNCIKHILLCTHHHELNAIAERRVLVFANCQNPECGKESSGLEHGVMRAHLIYWVTLNIEMRNYITRNDLQSFHDIRWTLLYLTCLYCFVVAVEIDTLRKIAGGGGFKAVIDCFYQITLTQSGK